MVNPKHHYPIGTRIKYHGTEYILVEELLTDMCILRYKMETVEHPGIFVDYYLTKAMVVIYNPTETLSSVIENAILTKTKTLKESYEAFKKYQEEKESSVDCPF